MKSQAQDVVADLTRLLESLPLHDASYAPPTIPTNGIYFFYEAGEKWPRGSALTAAQRVVRIGSHSGDNNLRTRIGNHFQATRRRSTFRYHLGAAILQSKGTKKEPQICEDRRGAVLPDIEAAVTHALRTRFTFRCLSLPLNEFDKSARLGLEARLIATFSAGNARPSNTWLGLHSPRTRIAESGLWNTNHVLSVLYLTGADVKILKTAIRQS